MHLYFTGAEVPSHLTLLKECGVTRVAVSASNLARNVKGKDLVNWANRARLAGLDWVLYADSDHTALSVVTQVLSGADIQPELVAGPVDWYTSTFLQDSDTLFLPTWDGHDPALLREYMEDYEGVTLPDAVVDNPSTVRVARAALPRMGTLAALTGRTKGLERFDVLMSSAWWAVQKYGETQVWTGDRMLRLNSEDKQTKRMRYTDQIAAMGVDVDKVLNDDPTETLRLAALSWLRLEQHLSAGRPLPVEADTGPQAGPLVTSPAFPSTVLPPGQVASGVAKGRHQMLPVMGLVATVQQDDQGKETTEQTLVVNAEGLRQCSSCKLSLVCPSYTVGAACAYAIPVTIRSKNELGGVLRALVEIQTQRILMGRFGEELLGEPDESVGREMDRLFKMVERWRDIEDGRDTLRMSVEAKGALASSGVLSRIFGERVGRNATMLAEPVESDDIIDHVSEE